MRRKLNVKLVAIVLASLVLAAFSAHFLHAYQLRTNAYRLLERADKAVQDKDYDKALSCYGQYLAFVPDDADTVQNYAEALDVRASSIGERLALILKMEQVLRVKPNQLALRLRLVHNLIALDRIGEAVGHLRKLKDNASDKADILHMLGWCHDAQREYPEAASSFTEAIRINPRQIRSYALLAEVQQERLNDPDAAQKTMDDLVEANADTYQAYLLRGQFLRRRGDEKAAQSDLQTAYRLGPDQADAILELADAARACGNWEEAGRLLKDGMKRFPDNAAFVKQIVSVEILTGKTSAAIDHLRVGIKRAPQAHELAILMVDLLIDQKQYAEARARIAELVKAGLKPALPNYLKARLGIAHKEYREAIGLLEEVRQDLGAGSEWQGRVHALLGYCYRQIGDHEQELQAFRRAVQDEPTWAVAGIGLGAAQLSNGRIEEALQTLEPLRTAPGLPADYWFLLARARLNRQLRLPAAERRWDAVEEALAKAASAAPDSIEAAIARADLLAARSDFAAARAVLEQARTTHPEAATLWYALAELEARQDHFDRAEQILEQALQKLGDRLELRLAQCRLWGARGSSDALTKLAGLDQAIPATFAPEQRVQLQREIADTWYRLGKLERAEKGWHAVAHELPKDSRSRFALFELALQKNQPDAARLMRDELRTIEGANGSLWRYADAAILVHEAHARPGQLDEARKKLDDLEQVHKNSPKVALLTATTFELEGNQPAAIQQYIRALDLGDLPPARMARLLELLLLRREFTKAETELAKYEQMQPLTREIARLGAEAALGLRNERYALLAVQRAEQAVPAPVRDYRDAVWLARVYQAAAESAKAEKLLRESIERDGHAPEVWIAWSEFLMQTNQRDKADEAIAKMKSVLPANRQALTLARCYEALRQPAQAAKAYQDALAAAEEDIDTLAYAADFYRRADQVEFAEKSYRRLLDPALLAGADYAVPARRHLAVLLAPRDPMQALALLEQNKKAKGDSVADQRVRLFIQSLTPAARLDAVRKFEDSLRLQPPTPDERLLLARMLEAADSAGAARDQLAEAVDEAPLAPQYRAAYAGLLIRMGELDEAQRQLARLEQLEPGSARSAAVRSALERAGKP